MENLREGERRTVTVLFSDMKGFTSLSEKMDPEEMDGLMDQIFGAFESVVLRFDGVVEKYIGDALVAVFGAPNIHEDDPARAINAALDFQSEVRHLNRSLRKRDAEIAFRTGINTGLVTTGKRGQFEVVTGHTMSVASRLEATAQPNGILVSDSTKEKCETDFLFSDPMRVPVRGAGHPILAYTVLGRNADAFARDEIFVNRQETLARMTKSFLRHNPEQTNGFYLLGPPGIGKTALVTKFIEKMQQYPDYGSGILHAKARPYRRASFSVIRDLILNYLRIENTRDAEGVRKELGRRIGLDDSTASEFADLIGGAAGSKIDNQAFVLLYVVLKHILKAHESSPYPVLLFIDNASLMERHSRDFFQFFLKNATLKPFFVLTDRRPHPVLGEVFADCERLTLSPLTREDAEAYLHILRPDLSDNSAKQIILKEGRGNPLFIREYARYAKETGVHGAVPSTIQNILLTSVDSFEPAYRDLLKKLSVFFAFFSMDDAVFLQERTEDDPLIVPQAITFFLQEGLIIEEKGSYTFSHDLLKHALYNSLLNYNKRILHRLIAERMQQNDRPHLFRLLDHLLRAEEYDAARAVLEKAPDLPLNPEYLKYLDALLEQTDPTNSEEVIKSLFMKSAILFNSGSTEQSDATLKQIVGLALREKSSAYLARAYHLLCAFNMKSYSFQKASFCGRKAVAYYRSVRPTEHWQHNIQNVLGILCTSEALGNNIEDALLCIEESEQLEDSSPLAVANSRAELHLIQGEYQNAADVLGPFTGNEDPDQQTALWLSGCFLKVLTLWHLCDFEGLKAAVDVLRVQEPRNYANLSQVHAYTAVACELTGETDRTAGYLQQAEFSALQANNDFDRVDALRTLSEAWLILKQYDKAEEVAKEGVAIALRNTAYYPGFSLLVILTELAFNQGNTAEASFFLWEATFLVQSNTTLRNRDLLLYHYFMARLESDERTTEHWTQASELLERERANMGSKEHFEALMSLRSYPRLQRDIDTFGGRRNITA